MHLPLFHQASSELVFYLKSVLGAALRVSSLAVKTDILILDRYNILLLETRNHKLLKSGAGEGPS